MISYQRYTDEFFPHIYNFLLLNNVEPPCETDELDENGIMAIDNGKLVGFIWALVGNTSKAYVDFFAVAEEYRGKTVAYRLIEKMDELLVNKGLKRYNFNIEKWNTSMVGKIINYAEKYKIRPLADLHYFQREL